MAIDARLLQHEIPPAGYRYQSSTRSRPGRAAPAPPQGVPTLRRRPPGARHPVLTTDAYPGGHHRHCMLRCFHRLGSWLAPSSGSAPPHPGCPASARYTLSADRAILVQQRPHCRLLRGSNTPESDSGALPPARCARAFTQPRDAPIQTNSRVQRCLPTRSGTRPASPHPGRCI